MIPIGINVVGEYPYAGPVLAVFGMGLPSGAGAAVIVVRCRGCLLGISLLDDWATL